jgi:hypothetical protein
MNKQEQYEALLKHFALTGQGVPVTLLKSYPDDYDWSLTEELIAEGKLEIVYGGAGHDHLIIADDKYYRTEVEDPKLIYIETMRHYIGIMEDDEIVPIFNISIKEIIELNKEPYDKWVKENKTKLDALKDLKQQLIKEGLLELTD